MAEDKSVLDFPLMEDTQDDDVLYVLRGTGPDRDRHQKKSDLLQEVGADKITVTEDVTAGDPLGVDIAGAYKRAGVRVSQPVYPNGLTPFEQIENVGVEYIGNDHYVMMWTIHDSGSTYTSNVRIFDIVAGEVRWLTDKYTWNTLSETFASRVTSISTDHFAIVWYLPNTGGIQMFVSIGHYNNDFADPTPGTITMDIAATGSEIIGSYGSQNFDITCHNNWIWLSTPASGGGVQRPEVVAGLWNGAGSIAWESWVEIEDAKYEFIHWQMSTAILENVAVGTDSAIVINMTMLSDKEVYYDTGHWGVNRYFAEVDAGVGITSKKVGNEKYTIGMIGLSRMEDNTFLEARITSNGVVVRVGDCNENNGDIKWISNTINAPHVMSLDNNMSDTHWFSPSTGIHYLGSGYFVMSCGTSKWERTLYIGHYEGGTIQWLYEDFKPLGVESLFHSVTGFGNNICTIGDMYYRDGSYNNEETMLIGQCMEFIPYTGVAGKDDLASEITSLVFSNTVKTTGLIPNKDYYMEPVGTLDGAAESWKVTFTNTNNGNGYFAFWLPNGTMHYVWENFASGDPYLGGSGLSIECDLGVLTTAAARVAYLLPLLNAIEGVTVTSPVADELLFVNDDIGAVQSVYFVSMDYKFEIITKGFNKLGLTTRPSRMKVGRSISTTLLSVLPEFTASNNKHDMKYIGKATLIEPYQIGNISGIESRQRPVKLVQTIFSIGPWNMASDDGRNCEFPEIPSIINSIVSMDVIIYHDSSGLASPLTSVVWPGTGQMQLQGGISLNGNGPAITLWRQNGGSFDSVNYSNSSINRGYVMITSFVEEEDIPMAIKGTLTGPTS